MTPEITVIIPNFNKSKYLEQCINSVLNQTFKSWNLIVIDDASTDESKKILNKFINHKQIAIIKLKKNKGVSFCRNLGMRLAQAEYISFLDSDDYWLEDKLEKHLNFLKNKNYVFSYTDYFFFNENNKNVKKTTNLHSEFNLLSFVKNTSINTSTIILKKNSIGYSRFKKMTLLEDYIFKCDLLKKNIIAYKFNQASTAYRITNDNRSSGLLKNLIQLIQVNKKYNKFNIFFNFYVVTNVIFNSIKKYGLRKYLQ